MSDRPQINIRVTKDMKKRLEALAERKGRSLSNLLQRIIQKVLDKENNNNQ